MKRILLIFIAVSGLIVSCSSDKAEDPKGEAAIVGTWQATELKAADSNSDQVNLGAEVLAQLTAEGCYILSLTFNEDLTLKVESSVNYLQINATPTGLDVPCPSQKDTSTGTYTYDGKVLTTVDSDLNTTNVNIAIDGGTMSVDATQLDIPNLNASGATLIFKRK